MAATTAGGGAAAPRVVGGERSTWGARRRGVRCVGGQRKKGSAKTRGHRDGQRALCGRDGGGRRECRAPGLLFEDEGCAAEPQGFRDIGHVPTDTHVDQPDGSRTRSTILMQISRIKGHVWDQKSGSVESSYEIACNGGATLLTESNNAVWSLSVSPPIATTLATIEVRAHAPLVAKGSRTYWGVRSDPRGAVSLYCCYFRSYVGCRISSVDRLASGDCS